MSFVICFDVMSSAAKARQSRDDNHARRTGRFGYVAGVAHVTFDERWNDSHETVDDNRNEH